MLGQNHLRRTQVLATYAAAGLTLPKKLADAIAAHDTAAAYSLDTHGIPAATFVAAAVQVILDGGNPADDQQVQQAAVEMALNANSHGIYEALRTRPAAVLDQLIRRDADTIISEWRKPFDSAAETLKNDNADTAAADTVAAITEGWAHLYALTTGGATTSTMPDITYRLLRFTAADYAAVRADIEGSFDATPRGAASAGLTFSLPSIAEYSQRVLAYEAEAARRLETARTRGARDYSFSEYRDRIVAARA